jgi:predicted aspartyl protease
MFTLLPTPQAPRLKPVFLLGCLLPLFPLVSLARQNPNSGIPLQKTPLTVAKNTIYPVTLSYTPWQGMATIHGTLNGKEVPERFVLSTGLNACTVTSAIYTRAELQALTRRARLNVLDYSAEGDEVQIKSLKLPALNGTLTLEEVPAILINPFAVISNSPRVTAPGANAPEGWLGSPFFATFQVTLDFERRVITLNAPDATPPKETGSMEAPIEIREGRVWVKVSAPKVKPFPMLLDTGSTNTLLPGDVAEKLGLKPVQVVTITRGSGQEGKAALAVCPELSIGKAKAKDVGVVFLAADVPAAFDRKLGVLGVDFLRHFIVTLDFARKRLILTPPPKPDEPPPAEEAETNTP